MLKQFCWLFLVLSGVTLTLVVIACQKGNDLTSGKKSSEENLTKPSASRLLTESEDGNSRESLRHRSNELENYQETEELRKLKSAVKVQEAKVEDRKKTLLSLNSSKAAFYSLSDTNSPEDANKKALDAQDFVDARRELNEEKILLQGLKAQLAAEEKNVSQ